MTATQTARKTSKAALREAVDSFLYRYSWLTGGTGEEVRKQAAAGIVNLEEMAATVSRLASNPAKLCAADSHLMHYANEVIPAKVAFYRETYVNGNTQAKREEEQLAAMLDSASRILGVEIGFLLGGKAELEAAPEVPSNIIFHAFR